MLINVILACDNHYIVDKTGTGLPGVECYVDPRKVLLQFIERDYGIKLTDFEVLHVHKSGRDIHTIGFYSKMDYRDSMVIYSKSILRDYCAQDIRTIAAWRRLHNLRTPVV